MARKNTRPPSVKIRIAFNPRHAPNPSPCLGSLWTNPIDGSNLVETRWAGALGAAWGRVDVKTLTVDEAEASIMLHLRTDAVSGIFRERGCQGNPDVQVSWARRGGPWREAVLPRVPYTISPGDVICVRVMGSILDQPIDGSYTVEPTGTIPLGPAYGRVQVQGFDARSG